MCLPVASQSLFQLGTKEIDAALMGRYIYREQGPDAGADRNNSRRSKIAQDLIDMQT
jgi:hypothetical protein